MLAHMKARLWKPRALDPTVAVATRDSYTLPTELRLYIISLLPLNDLALGGRLAFKEASQHFSKGHHRTVLLSQPLPGHVIATGQAPAEAALPQLNSQQKLQLLSTAASSGCLVNVELMLQLVEQQLHPTTLHADRYGSRLQPLPILMCEGMPLPAATSDVGSAAVASGLAHLLPSLAQRCPGLLDSGRTLEAAARHCDLAGLQAAWEVLGGPLRSSLESEDADCPPEIWDEMRSYSLDERGPGNEWLHDLLRSGAEHALLRSYRRLEHVHGVWRRMAAAAAGSFTSDFQAKVEWVLHVSRGARRPTMGAAVWGAAAATGDAARLRWLHDRGFRIDSNAAVHAVVQHAGLDFLQGLEECGHLDLKHGVCSFAHTAATGAAAGPCDGAVKLKWLAEKGVKIGTYSVAMVAAQYGNLEALQLLKGQPSACQRAFTSGDVLAAAVLYGHVPVASWLAQVGPPLEYNHRSMCLRETVRRGDLPMLRWLLENGCHRRGLTQARLSRWWPVDTAADRRRLVEALQLVAA